MSSNLVFVDRRKGQDRRLDEDPCKDLDIDLYHRKRRKSADRRDNSRDITDDYYAYMRKQLGKADYVETPKAKKQNRQ
jgi:hypothetical protein